MQASPVDSAGLLLPDPSWPDQPGSAGLLEPLRRCCNTTNREDGADAWRTAGELTAWLVREGYGNVEGIDDEGLRRLVRWRDALWGLIDTGDHEAVAAATGAISVRMASTPDGIALVPGEPGLDGVIAELALMVVEARAAGVLERLRTCRRCHWVFHDTSRNRSRQWCSMSACGGRSKARAYRERRR